jgi:hypothetical protein
MFENKKLGDLVGMDLPFSFFIQRDFILFG